MKIIHTADIHLGSKMDSRFNKEISDERKAELRSTFKRMVDYAKQHDVRAILLCGDIFDSDRPFKKDKDLFYGIVAAHADIDFLYLKGNHDTNDPLPEDAPANLKTFSDSWTAYRYGSVCIAGTELTAANASSCYASLSLSKEDVNIVMLHGQIGDSADNGDIRLKKLKNKNIDYLALGHVHKFSYGTLDERGKYAYCGCLEGRGFDETGDHGFVLLDIGDDKKISYKFISFALRRINETDVDVSGSKNAYDAYTKVRDGVAFNDRDLYRINLIGAIEAEADKIADDVEKLLSDSCYFVSVKDRTTRKIDLSKYEKDLSIKGAFVRAVFARADLSEEDKVAVIHCGLRALDGKEIDL